jgi:hypothetical protein
MRELTIWEFEEIARQLIYFWLIDKGRDIL